MKIAIVGAGPAGSRAAELLSNSGHEVTIFDAYGPWEKPCGGGLTTRALRLGGAVPEALPRQIIEKIDLYYGDNCSVSMTPREPLAVVSRQQFGEHMLAAALAAGSRFVRERVTDLEPGESWRIRTRGSECDADFVVGADGATSFVRRKVAQPFAGDDLSVTLGYFIRGEGGPTMKVFFVPGLEGYLWSFPRPDHVSYGLITRPEPQWTNRGRALLENYIVAELGSEAMEQAEFYSAPVPGLRSRTWATNPISGKDWALIGDAAGLVDPITGEGIYYALHSAEVLASTFPDPGAYKEALSGECAELARAAGLYDLFYRRRFLGASFRKRLVQLARYSPTIRRRAGELIAGTQPYRGLRRKLLRSGPRVALELVAAPFRRQNG